MSPKHLSFCLSLVTLPYFSLLFISLSFSFFLPVFICSKVSPSVSSFVSISMAYSFSYHNHFFISWYSSLFHHLRLFELVKAFDMTSYPSPLFSETHLWTWFSSTHSFSNAVFLLYIILSTLIELFLPEKILYSNFVYVSVHSSQLKVVSGFKCLTSYRYSGGTITFKSKGHLPVLRTMF